MNRWAIGDVHGCFNTLQSLIENVLCVQKDDEIYFLGDVIDRGMKSKEVLDYIIQKQSDGYHFKVLKGNHEYFLLKVVQTEINKKKQLLFGKKKSKKIIDTWLQRDGGYNTLKSFHVQNALEIPETYISFLQSLPYFFKVGNTILTHAGLNAKIDNPYQDIQSLLFGSNNQYDNDFLKNRIVIHGHNAISMEAITILANNTDKYHYICIDNGCVYGRHHDLGHLLAINLDTLEIKKQVNID